MKNVTLKHAYVDSIHLKKRGERTRSRPLVRNWGPDLRAKAEVTGVKRE